MNLGDILCMIVYIYVAVLVVVFTSQYSPYLYPLHIASSSHADASHLLSQITCVGMDLPLGRVVSFLEGHPASSRFVFLQS